MSSKNAHDTPISHGAFSPIPKTWSLAARLTAWNAGSGFLLVLTAAGFLYSASVRNLDRQNDRLLGDRVRVLQSLMLSNPGDKDTIRREVAEEWEARQRTQVHMRILDEHGQVVAETPEMNGLLPSLAFPAPAAEADEGVDLHSTSRGLFRVLAVQGATESSQHSPYVIQVAMERSLERELLAGYRKNLALVLGVALLVCVLAGYGIARRVIRPIDDITETARHIRPTNLSERITPDGLPAELLTLAATFNQMLNRLEHSFDRLSRFSADIAHELRTPVFNLRGGIDVALSKPRSAEEYREVLASALEECGRLAHLIDRLLFLARAEHPETAITREPCDVGLELATVSAFYGLAATEAGVRLTVTPHGNVLADLDRPLFQRAVGNVVTNALAHTPAGGTVTLTATGDDTVTRVEVVDTGCGISAVNLPHVFDRFYRVDPSRSSKHGNVGLGLAIMHAIVELHGGSVEIASEVGRGTRVALIFPKHCPMKKT
jgi:two-component system heavy metal sensor histidine kinase CusS